MATPLRATPNSAQTFTPSMQAPLVQHAGPIGSPAELSALFTEIRQDARAERDEFEVKMERQRDEAKAEMEKLRAEIRAELTPAPAQELISPEQLAVLQARLESLHAAQLLSDEEFFALEDLCADFLELQGSTVGVLSQDLVCSSAAYGVAAKLAKMVVVSEGITSDAGFARQARRKFV